MNADRGSVLMEYVILCCFVGIIAIEFFHTQFYNFEDGFVGLGLDWAGSVQQLHRAIALPVP